MKILIIGANGRMGKCMQEECKNRGVSFVAVDKDDRFKAKNFDGDVILDFSVASALKDNLALAKRLNLPLVIATTGHDEDGLKLIKDQKNFIPIFISSNFSLLFNFLLSLLENFFVVKGCDFVVSETHHKHKMDSPSGSCKEIIKILEKNDIYPTVASFRAGEVVGRHEIEIFDDYESLKITHNANSRTLFCQGALRACQYILDKPNGLYSMGDLLGEND